MAKLTIAERERLLQLQKEELNLEKQSKELSKEKREELEKLLELERSTIETGARKVERLKEEAGLLNDIIESLKEQKKLGVELGSLYEDDLAAREKALELQAAEYALSKEATVEQKNQNLLAQKRLAIEKQGAGDAEGLLKRMTGITKTPTTVLGKVAQDPTAYMKGTMGGMKGLVSGASIMTSTIDKVVEATVAMALEQDKAVVQFNRATGASGQFDAQIQDTNFNLRFAGVSAAEAGQSFQDLFMVVSDFTLMTKEEQMVLGETTAILNELGIASQDTAANIQLATKGLGMSVEQSEYLVRDLKTFAQDLGLSTGQVAKDFSRMAPMITEIGTKGVQAFKNLQKVAKATNIDIQRLYQITSKFDTFTDAADAVGGLNAVLGGPFLNTMQMVMEEDPAERFRMLKGAVDDAGLSFDSMTKFQRKAIAAQMGLNDTYELAAVLRGRMDLLPTAEEDADTIIAMQEETAKFNDIMEELKQIGMAFAIALGPTIGYLKDFLQMIQPALPLVAALTLAVAAMGSPFIAVGLAILGVAYALGKLKEMRTGVKPAAMSGVEDTMGTLKSSGKAMTTAMTGMPAASVTADSNRQAIASAGGGDVILDGRKVGDFVNKSVSSPAGAVGQMMPAVYG